MTRTGIKIDLDVGDLVSNAGRARGAISALADAMKKAEQEGRSDDYGKLAYEKEKLQGRSAGFERDVENFTSNPRFQIQTPNGTAVFKLDTEYAELIKGQMASMRQLAEAYEEAVKTGNIAKAQGISPQIERQQDDFHKIVEEIRGSPAIKTPSTIISPSPYSVASADDPLPRQQSNDVTFKQEGRLARSPAQTEHNRDLQPTLFPLEEIPRNPVRPEDTNADHRPELPPVEEMPRIPAAPEGADTVRRPEPGHPIRGEDGISQSIGGFVSSAAAARQIILNIDKEIEKAQKAGDELKVGQLYYTKQRMNTVHEQLERDTNTLTGGQQYRQIMDKQAAGQVLSKREEAYVSHLDLLNDALKKNTAALLDAAKSGDADELLKQAPQISRSIDDFQRITGTADPSKARGMQDAVKAIGIGQIANAINDGFSRWAGSLDRSGIVNQYGSGDILGGRIAEERRQADLEGGILQSVLAIGGTALGFALGGPGGAMLGGTLGGGAGKAIDTALHIGPNKDATEAAYAGLWQQRAAPAMELAALQGTPEKIRDAFKTAADAAAQFGYSAEEGMEAMKEAARQGLGGEEARQVMQQSMAFERGTGADRGTLMGISAMSERYGAGNALGTGWQGLQASGMKPGQYNEYLRAMQRVMEDGISKGFVRSSEQAAKNLTMLSEMTGNNPLWQGENGARRLSEMNAGLESATGLSSATDILAYRGAQNVLKGMSDEDWKKAVGDQDKDGLADIKKSGDYIDSMILLEKGLSANLFKEQMKLIDSAEGGGRTGSIERVRQMYGLNYHNSAMLYDTWKTSGDSLSEEKIEELIKLYGKEPPAANSPELDAAKKIEEIKNLMTQTGQDYWDDQMTKLPQELAKAIREYNEKTGSSKPVPGREEIPITDDMSPQERYNAAEHNAQVLHERGDYAGAGQANTAWKRAEMDSLARTNDIFAAAGKVKQFGGLLYDQSWFSGKSGTEKREDREAQNKFYDIFDVALRGDENQYRQAQEAIGIMDTLPKDVYKQLDRDQYKGISANSLANASDMGEFISLLRQIVENTRDTASNTKETHMVELP